MISIKKRLTILLILVIALSSCIVVINSKSEKANAESIPTIQVESKTGENSVHRGQTFTLSISISNNTQGLTGLYLTYLRQGKDTNDVFRLKNIERGSALSTLTLTSSNTATGHGLDFIEPTTGGFNFILDGTEKDYSNGEVLRLTFESDIDAQLKDYDFEFSFDRNNTRTEIGSPIDVNIINGVVTLIAGEYKVVYQNYDGTVLYEKDCISTDKLPTFPYDNPTRPATEQYTYEFEKFESVVSLDKDTITYRAKFKEIPVMYNIWFYVEGELKSVVETGFGTYADLTYRPEARKNYSFSGWYYDEDCTDQVKLLSMPSHDVYLYGKYKLNIREEDIPKLLLVYTGPSDGDIPEDNIYIVDVYLVKNTGIASMKLTLDYDRAINFIGYEQGEVLKDKVFSTTNVNTEAGYSAENFRFYWEGSVNNYDYNEDLPLITLKFTIPSDAQNRGYRVSFNYTRSEDIIYNTNNEGAQEYTDIEIIDCTIPYKKINYWTNLTEEQSSDLVKIEIESEDYVPSNVVGVFTDITSSIDKTNLSQYAKTSPKNITAYGTGLTQNNISYVFTSKFKITTGLTDEQKNYNKLTVVCTYSDGTKEAIKVNQTKDGKVSFDIDKLCTSYVIFGEDSDYISASGVSGRQTLFILLPSLLAIATMGTFLIYLGLKRKKY